MILKLSRALVLGFLVRSRVVGWRIQRNDTTGLCLALKKKKICAGTMMGYGGNIENGENPRQAMARELTEESGGVIARPEDFEPVAQLLCENHPEPPKEPFLCLVYTYLIHRWRGEPKETEEMGAPKWFSPDQIPIAQLPPADPDWLPHVLRGVRFSEVFARYGPNQKTLLEPVRLTPCHSLNF